MKQFRYVINGHACSWQNCASMPIAKLEYIAKRFNTWYGNNWEIEYR